MRYQPLPASTYVICQYAAFLARSLKYNSIRSYPGIIGLFHKKFGLANPLTGNWMVKQKLPITLSTLKGIFKLLKPRNSFDASFWAVCMVAFYGFFRTSHLLPLSPAKYDPQKQFSRSDFKFLSWGALVKMFTTYSLYFHYMASRATLLNAGILEIGLPQKHSIKTIAVKLCFSLLWKYLKYFLVTFCRTCMIEVVPIIKCTSAAFR